MLQAAVITQHAGLAVWDKKHQGSGKPEGASQAGRVQLGQII